MTSVPPQYPGLNLELKTEPLPYTGESQGPHLPGEGAAPHVMMGYEGSYPHPQYHAGYEERHAGASIQWPGYHGHHHGGVGHSQGSPTQRYPYYDSRGGYYSHPASSSQGVTSDPGGGTWHEPVSRADSPGAGGGAAYQGANTGNMYSCKMQAPPSPQETKVSSGRETCSLTSIPLDGGRRRRQSPRPVPGILHLWPDLEQQPPARRPAGWSRAEQLQPRWTRPALTSPARGPPRRFRSRALSSLPLDEESVW